MCSLNFCNKVIFKCKYLFVKSVVNSVVYLSNHSEYGCYGGTKTTAAELDEMFESMEHNELLISTRLLTGYDSLH